MLLIYKLLYYTKATVYVDYKTKQLETPIEITHNPPLMLSVRNYRRKCCFQFSSLCSQGYQTINQSRIGFERGLFYSCSFCLFLWTCEYLRCHSHRPPQPSSETFSFIPYVADVQSFSCSDS